MPETYGRKKATKKTTKKVARKSIPRRLTTDTTRLRTEVYTTVMVEVPTLTLPSRLRLGDDSFTSSLAKGKLVLNGGYSERQTVKFIFKDGHLHAKAGCNCLFNLMSKAEYEAFCKWADAQFADPKVPA